MSKTESGSLTTYFGIVTPHGDKDLVNIVSGYGLVSWGAPDIKLSSNVFCTIHLTAIS